MSLFASLHFGSRIFLGNRKAFSLGSFRHLRAPVYCTVEELLALYWNFIPHRTEECVVSRCFRAISWDTCVGRKAANTEHLRRGVLYRGKNTTRSPGVDTDHLPPSGETHLLIIYNVFTKLLTLLGLSPAERTPDNVYYPIVYHVNTTSLCRYTWPA